MSRVIVDSRRHVEAAGHRVVRHPAGPTPAEAAQRFGVSRQWVYQLLARDLDDGLDAVEAQSHRPRSNPRQTAPALAEQILELRRTLVAHGLDADPTSIAAQLKSDALHVPSTWTIGRILQTRAIGTTVTAERSTAEGKTAAVGCRLGPAA